MNNKESEYSLSHLLKKTLEYYNLNDVVENNEIVEKYSEIVGQQINKYSKAIKFEKGILFIEVENSAWKNELLLMSEKIKEKINQYFEKEIVKEIKII